MSDLFKALIVEDDADIANLVRLQVGSLKGQATILDRLEQAKSYVESNVIDLLILDLSLPDGDGLEFCRYFRRQNHITPILMLTARSDEQDKVAGLELGADDYLSKPFGLEELKARIKALMRRSRTHNTLDTIVQVGCLKLDLQSHQAWLKDTLLELTTKEFDLLKLFAVSPNQVFTRHDLLAQIWGSDYFGFEHTISSHINRLRKKIEKNPAKPKILETVWGVGYRLNPVCLSETIEHV
ncbi:response regulator transcription factor [Hydrogenovibrio marinus]|uniref:Phosphate regulon transcriptional regulatory protein PhoB n=1 Tax=Hydrogenovibrio marinus TaxID=28885 RepID=A0A066ZRE4_HYDMR|nr:response regulator transcription factor [Hydrogenovibrio marinus]KDN96067.1 transcriptional regulator [Hydrogenovibrio marinus]BBN58436.1 DNA-binding response regulator [Hydrogenovibrio marinus]